MFPCLRVIIRNSRTFLRKTKFPPQNTREPIVSNGCMNIIIILVIILYVTGLSMYPILNFRKL